ncbi:excalibur calcium-binding domain-containing protein [Helcobacillus massiliensis]|uniref:GmrSD restriction endonuclease domain-containing protein n=1 Tax=Helcobacillus massiliensis TaxID=521392 RepID=UPI0021A3B5D6|nr:DUF1524 domain-containing protein [Helcobacillus massiliensis]MCT1556562.1 excalibur calcium-binding domain-containing protein [Helcobacillus massiliensis]MCT2035756.1 excalibur calcium-binding domain-containing protein [Helcobacillus massiliensis]MCT2331162.1 excalibur calcium-binding domain-containing protein [Helcobacillus massiliensis]
MSLPPETRRLIGCGTGCCTALMVLLIGLLVAIGVIAGDTTASPEQTRPGIELSEAPTGEPSTATPASAPPSASPTPSATATAQPTTPAASSAAPTPAAKPSTAQTPSAAPAQKGTPAPADGTALATLRTLEVKGRAPETGYDRDDYQWRQDTDHNGCDTRNDVLRRDLQAVILKRGTRGCVVAAGQFTDLYSGKVITFDEPSDADIDHIVALQNAHVTGAFRFGSAKRMELANDPLNLIAVDASLNRQKGSADAATWLPPNTAFRCEYVARQISVKKKYGLWVTPPERDAMERILTSCPDQKTYSSASLAWPGRGEGDVIGEGERPKPVSGSDSTTSEPKKKQPASSPKPAAPKKEQKQGVVGDSQKKPGSGREPSGGSVRFKNCREAWDAGAAPLRRGDPGYESKHDGDGDGVACEKRPR